MPDAPTNLRFNDTNTEDELTIDWDQVSGADEYYVYRAQSSGSTTSDYTRVATPASPPYTDIGLEDGEKYYYRVSAYSALPDSGQFQLGRGATVLCQQPLRYYPCP